jgi:hypothetical protein
MSGQLHAPAALPSETSPGTHFIWGWVDPRASLDEMGKWKFFTLPGFELPIPLVVQPVASRYTDWAIPAPILHVGIRNGNMFITRKENIWNIYNVYKSWGRNY